MCRAVQIETFSLFNHHSMKSITSSWKLEHEVSEEEIQRARFKAEKLALQELGLGKVLERHCLLTVPHSSALVSSKIVGPGPVDSYPNPDAQDHGEGTWRRPSFPHLSQPDVSQWVDVTSQAV